MSEVVGVFQRIPNLGFQNKETVMEPALQGWIRINRNFIHVLMLLDNFSMKISGLGFLV